MAFLNCGCAGASQAPQGSVVPKVNFGTCHFLTSKYRLRSKIIVLDLLVYVAQVLWFKGSHNVEFFEFVLRINENSPTIQTCIVRNRSYSHNKNENEINK